MRKGVLTRLKIKTTDIPLTKQDRSTIAYNKSIIMRYIVGGGLDMNDSTVRDRINLYESIKKEGLKKPIGIFSLHLPNPHNIDRGFGRLAVLDILNQQDIEVVLRDCPE